MKRVRAASRALLLLAPLLLVATGPSGPVPDRTPGELDSDGPSKLGVVDWLTILPAPDTPANFEPTAGPRVQWPLRGTLTQPFGCTDFALERPRADCPGGFHTGLDIAQPQGTPIRAALDGLAYSLPDEQGYGNHVVIQHQGGLATVYGHMVRMNAGWRQPVRRGDVIGWVGSTGNSTGPHLHFEVRFAGAPQDPMPYLDGSPEDPFPLPAGWPGTPRNDLRGRR
jgi:murein DD-endopeptidase MepM/ murein hydrolase activator NlpD